MEEEDQPKIDFKQHALEPVPRRYLVRIAIYVVMFVVAGFFMFYMYNRNKEAKKVVNPEEIKEIRGFTLSDSL